MIFDKLKKTRIESLKQESIDKYIDCNQGLIKKLNSIFNLGYVPNRGNETYNYILKSGYQTTSLINCFAHSCFNLTNKQIEDSGISMFEAIGFQNFPITGFSASEIDFSCIINFIEETGLNVEFSSLHSVTGPNQWKVAYYFDYHMQDFHFMLQEKDKTWSSKIANCPDIEYYDTPPDFYKNEYELLDFLTITNNLKRERE